MIVPNQKEILAMRAGPELNALVAERVMGWGIRRNAFGYWLGPGTINANTWSPSSDMSAVWEVVSKLRESHHLQLKTEDEGWAAKFGLVDPTDFQDMAEWSYDTTAPLVICRAALLTTLRPASTSPPP